MEGVLTEWLVTGCGRSREQKKHHGSV